ASPSCWSASGPTSSTCRSRSGAASRSTTSPSTGPWSAARPACRPSWSPPGALFPAAAQLLDHRANPPHADPPARSGLLYKAGLLGGSRNIFNGNLIISPGARGTDAGQTMRNLVLSRDAHAEANPFLEILNSDVKAAHAAATGRVDD